MYSSDKAFTNVCLGQVYANFGDWKAILEGSLAATKFGEASVSAIDYGLYAYVPSKDCFAYHLGESVICVVNIAVPTKNLVPFSAENLL